MNLITLSSIKSYSALEKFQWLLFLLTRFFIVSYAYMPASELELLIFGLIACSIHGMEPTDNVYGVLLDIKPKQIEWKCLDV